MNLGRTRIFYTKRNSRDVYRIQDTNRPSKTFAKNHFVGLNDNLWQWLKMRQNVIYLNTSQSLFVSFYPNVAFVCAPSRPWERRWRGTVTLRVATDMRTDLTELRHLFEFLAHSQAKKLTSDMLKPCNCKKNIKKMLYNIRSVHRYSIWKRQMQTKSNEQYRIHVSERHSLQESGRSKRYLLSKLELIKLESWSTVLNILPN